MQKIKKKNKGGHYGGKVTGGEQKSRRWRRKEQEERARYLDAKRGKGNAYRRTAAAGGDASVRACAARR